MKAVSMGRLLLKTVLQRDPKAERSSTEKEAGEAKKKSKLYTKTGKGGQGAPLCGRKDTIFDGTPEGKEKGRWRCHR